MADILLDNQVVPSTPASGKSVVFVESGGKRLTTKDDAGRYNTLSGSIYSNNTSDVVANAAEAYLTGSGLVIPTGLTLQVGMVFKWTIVMTKTNVSTSAPVWNIRVGTAGTTADTVRVAFTGPAQTAAADVGQVDMIAVLRNVGASGIMAGGLVLSHGLAATGFANVGTVMLQTTSSAFDTTTANLIVGVSVNPGTGVWTHQVVHGQVEGI
jgi:hypothetical protein